MSRKDSELKQRIVDRAMELFNAHGISSVGMRELARDLGLSPGNLTYHFARKEDVLQAIGARLTAANSATLEALANVTTLAQFFEALRQIFSTQYRFRCLALNLIFIFETYPDMAAGYVENQVRRAESFKQIMRSLRAAGALQQDVDEALVARLANFCSLIGRFWLSEYWVGDRSESVDEAIQRYLALLALTLLPYATEGGYRDLEPLLNYAAA